MTLNNLSAYGIGFQVKVLSSLLTHKEFLLNIQDVLSEEYFDNQAHKWIIKEILKYYQKYHTTPSMDVLKPIITPYNLEFPGQSIHKSACKECILDMLRWAIGQTKIETETIELVKKVKKKKQVVVSGK